MFSLVCSGWPYSFLWPCLFISNCFLTHNLTMVSIYSLSSNSSAIRCYDFFLSAAHLHSHLKRCSISVSHASHWTQLLPKQSKVSLNIPCGIGSIWSLPSTQLEHLCVNSCCVYITLVAYSDEAESIYNRE